MSILRRLRTRLDLTQIELASLLSMSQSSVSLYEGGATIPPNVGRKVIELAASYGIAISFDDLYRNAHAAGTAKIDGSSSDGRQT